MKVDEKLGAVLALTAGVHGMEYPPILALQRLRASMDPRTLAGTIIMVHVVNMPSFLGRTIYYSPIDGKNLNRVFPGKADGTISERIADVIYDEERPGRGECVMIDPLDPTRSCVLDDVPGSPRVSPSGDWEPASPLAVLAGMTRA